MPKKFDDAKKKEWLDLYEQGKTEKWIAHRSKCDVRTVKKAINDARLKRDVVVARIELVKDALRKHQDSLLEELDRISSYLIIPPKDYAVLSWRGGENSILNDPDENIQLESGDNSTMKRLLKEHLKNDKLWKELGRWEKVRANHLAARVTFQQKTVALLQEKTRYKLIDGDSPKPFLCSYTAGPLFYEAAIDIATATSKEKNPESAIKNIETAITVNTKNGDVTYENRLRLAAAPGHEQQTKQHLLDALNDLAKSPEVETVVETCQVLDSITVRTRQTVEDIKLLGLVPGQCEICRRLGM